jgi:hypothetical protein
MSAVVTVEYEVPGEGGITHVYGTLAMDSSYPTGGEPIATTGDVDFLYFFCQAGSVSMTYDRANKKVLAYASNGAAPALLDQVADTTNLSAITAAPFYGIRPN